MTYYHSISGMTGDRMKPKDRKRLDLKCDCDICIEPPFAAATSPKPPIDWLFVIIICALCFQVIMLGMVAVQNPAFAIATAVAICAMLGWVMAGKSKNLNP